LFATIVGDWCFEIHFLHFIIVYLNIFITFAFPTNKGATTPTKVYSLCRGVVAPLLHNKVGFVM
jgi:hypothetical protein